MKDLQKNWTIFCFLSYTIAKNVEKFWVDSVTGIVNFTAFGRTYSGSATTVTKMISFIRNVLQVHVSTSCYPLGLLAQVNSAARIITNNFLFRCGQMIYRIAIIEARP